MKTIEEWDEESSEPVDFEKMDALVKAYQDSRNDYDEKKKVSNDAHHIMEEMKAKVISALNASGKKKYFVEGVGTVTRRDDLVYSYPKDNSSRSALHEYMQGRYGKETLDALLSINAATFKAWAGKEAKARISEGLSSAIPGVSDPTVYENLVLTKEKGVSTDE